MRKPAPLYSYTWFWFSANSKTLLNDLSLTLLFSLVAAARLRSNRFCNSTCLPITFPISSGSTFNSRMMDCSPCISLTSTASGLSTNALQSLQLILQRLYPISLLISYLICCFSIGFYCIRWFNPFFSHFVLFSINLNFYWLEIGL